MTQLTVVRLFLFFLFVCLLSNQVEQKDLQRKKEIKTLFVI